MTNEFQCPSLNHGRYLFPSSYKFPCYNWDFSLISVMWVSSRKPENSTAIHKAVLTHSNSHDYFYSYTWKYLWTFYLLASLFDHPSSELPSQITRCLDFVNTKVLKPPLKSLLFVFSTSCAVTVKQTMWVRKRRPSYKESRATSFFFFFFPNLQRQLLLGFEAEIEGRSHHAISTQSQKTETPEKLISQSFSYEENDLAPKSSCGRSVLSASCL